MYDCDRKEDCDTMTADDALVGFVHLSNPQNVVLSCLYVMVVVPAVVGVDDSS